jgi:hypothetical protein
MAVLVTKQFRDDFATWAHERVRTGDWSQQEVDGLKEMFRTAELVPGPGVPRDPPHCIPDVGDRVALWTAYFADEAKAIRSRPGPSVTGQDHPFPNSTTKASTR